MLATSTCIEDPHDDLIAAIREAQKHDRLAQDTIGKLTGTGGTTSTGGTESAAGKWKMSTGVLTMEGRIYVPDSLRTRILERFHDNPESGHFGSTRTLELAARDFFWHGMDGSARKYVAGCRVCHRVKAPRHAKYGTNMPIEPPSRPWEGLTMDFVTDLPESTASGYTGIAVIVDRFTKCGIYLPCRKDIDSPELVRLFFEEVICKHGMPDHVITDRGTQFTSRFWTRVCSHLSVDHC